MPPKVLAKNNDRAGGVLPISAAARATPVKNTTARLKLEIRRLPPGLSLTEFEETLGDEWKLGSGKVDWREYRQGKVKSSAGKIPEQSRCYMHLTNEGLVKELEAKFFSVVFHDKAGTHRNHDIRNLPPTLGYAPNQRTPLGVKLRSDNRQGTIDQDPEFIAFLEAETQPIIRPASLDAVGAEKKETEKVEITSTPLIDALREKKANKAKAAATKEEKKESKAHSKAESKDATAEQEKAAKDGKSVSKKGEPATKEPAKAVNKQIATKQQPPRAASPQQPPTKPASPLKIKKAAPSPKPQAAITASPGNANSSVTASASQSSAPQRPPRQRGNADGIKKMLQKDLGLRAKTSNPAPTTPAPNIPATPSSNTVTSPTNTPIPTAPQSSAKSVKSPPQVAQPQSLKAYLKHANPSQGMTEILIQQALSQHGEVSNVTIDPRKGTAIAIFKSVEGLKKAIEVKKVPVANGSVEVLEFRDRGSSAGNNVSGSGGGPVGGRGGFRGRGGRGGRGGGAVGAAAGNTNGKAAIKSPTTSAQGQQSQAPGPAPAPAPASIPAKDSS